MYPEDTLLSIILLGEEKAYLPAKRYLYLTVNTCQPEMALLPGPTLCIVPP